MNYSKYLCIIIICTSLLSCSLSKKRPFWTVKNIDTSAEHVKKIEDDTYFCTHVLDSIFPKQPPILTIQAYGNRETFLKDLQNQLNFSKDQSEQYKNSGSHRPRGEFYFSPPGMVDQKHCHEIAHLYIDAQSSANSHKWPIWIDEGSAEYFSSIAYKSDLSRPQSLFKNDFAAILSFSEISDPKVWSQSYQNLNSRRITYSQAHLMIHYLVKKNGLDKFKSFIKKTSTFEDSFNQTPEEFYNDWKNTLINEMKNKN